MADDDEDNRGGGEDEEEQEQGEDGEGEETAGEAKGSNAIGKQEAAVAGGRDDHEEGGGGGGGDSLGAGGSGGSSRPAYEALGLTPAQLRRMEPLEVYKLFDTDDSGLISFSEFKELLRALQLDMPDAKALRFFRICDRDNSGEIDFDEFQTVLYATDPEGGNPTGYTPSSLIGPRDVYDMFDEDRSGQMDEDEFFYALDYLGIKVSDQKLEKLFGQFDSDESGLIEYPEFKQCWLLTCDLDHELEERGIDVPKFASRAWKMKTLDDLTHEEETKELLSIAEAVRWRKWQDSLDAKKQELVMVERRAILELQKALDLAGQVYVIGTGTNNQFASNPRKLLQTAHFSQDGFNYVLQAWKKRLDPLGSLPHKTKRLRQDQQQQEKAGGEEEEGLSNLDYILKFEIEEPEVEANKSPFNNKVVALNTCALWGRRVREVAVSESVVFCLSDLGEVYGLGGRDLWWWKIEHDSVWTKEWRGNTTERSRLLLTTMNIKRSLDSQGDEGKGGGAPVDGGIGGGLGVGGAELQEDEDEDELAELYKTMAVYYDVWKPPRGDQQSRMIYLRKDIIPKIGFDELRMSLQLRCYQDKNIGKQAMMEVLYKDFDLEKKTLGEKAHRRLKELEQQIRDLKEKKKMSLVKEITALIQKEWRPLRDTRVEEDLRVNYTKEQKRYNEYMSAEERYKKYRKYIYQARQDMTKTFTPRGLGLDIKVAGVTARSAPLTTPRGYETATHVAAGSNHVCLVHQSGQLYTWGLGAAGRLGHDYGEKANTREDCANPTLVLALLGKAVTRTSCGFSHTMALTASGDVYAWGSAINGKLGLGPIDEHEEVYCSVPTRLLMDKNQRIKRISCGSSHSAAITMDGSLYVWGCGDGGRLGLGQHDMGSHYTPTRVMVAGLDVEKVGTVSCGNAHTLVSTVVVETYQGGGDERVRIMTGGRVLMAGSPSVLGHFYPTFTTVQSLQDQGLTVHMVSAGHLHSAVLTTEGALYAWGYNHSGCCGQPIVEQFVPEPKCIRFLYDAPHNLALKKRASQSTTMGKGVADLAVDGKVDPTRANHCTCTRADNSAWWQVDLGDYCTVSYIKIFNRTDQAEGQDPLKYMKRLFPCWVICSREPMNEDMYGEDSLEQAMSVAVVKKRFTDLQQQVVWRLPERKLVRYLRIQLEQQNFLTLAQVEVYGNIGLPNSVGRVTHFQCGRNVTVAVVGPSTKPEEVHNAYKRAIQADSYHADVLRQYETYMPEYDKIGRGEVLDTCAICKGYSCERCLLRVKYKEEMTGMPLGPGGRLRRLRSIKDFLTVSGQPPLDFKEPERYKKPTLGEKLGKMFGTTFKRSGSSGGEDDLDKPDKESSKALKNLSALQKDFALAHK